MFKRIGKAARGLRWHGSACGFALLAKNEARQMRQGVKILAEGLKPSLTPLRSLNSNSR